MPEETRRCKTCRKLKPLSHFERNPLHLMLPPREEVPDVPVHAVPHPRKPPALPTDVYLVCRPEENGDFPVVLVRLRQPTGRGRMPHWEMANNQVELAFEALGEWHAWRLPLMPGYFVPASEELSDRVQWSDM